MGIFGFYKRPRYKKFEYNPRFYDPEKEELLERVRAAQKVGSEEDDAESIRKRIKGGFSRAGHSSNQKLISYRRKYKKKSNLRIIVLILLLSLLVYLIIGT